MEKFPAPMVHNRELTKKFHQFCKIVCFFWNLMVYYLRIMMNHKKS